jgi:hypothetical protein
MPFHTVGQINRFNLGEISDFAPLKSGPNDARQHGDRQ